MVMAPKAWRPQDLAPPAARRSHRQRAAAVAERPRLGVAALQKKGPKPLKNKRRRTMLRPSFGAQGESGLLRPVAVQVRAMRLEPGFGAVRLRAGAAQEAPELRRMVEVDEM